MHRLRLISSLALYHTSFILTTVMGVYRYLVSVGLWIYKYFLHLSVKKSKSSFTKDEADEIRNLLDKMQGKSFLEKIKLRNSLTRKLKFYISDFRRTRFGFNREAFDYFVRKGEITIK